MREHIVAQLSINGALDIGISVKAVVRAVIYTVMVFDVHVPWSNWSLSLYFY